MNDPIAVDVTITSTETNAFSDKMQKTRNAVAQESFAQWQEMSEEYREILTHIMSKSLEHIQNEIINWLPYASVSGNAGNQIDMMVSVLLSNDESHIDLYPPASLSLVQENTHE